MAKKSAFSKGYRKTAKAKPFLTKKEIIALIIIAAVILVGVLLFNLLYDDGYIKAREVQSGDIVSYASMDLKDRYKKIAEIGEIEGFTLEERAEGAAPNTGYTFYPDSEIDHITHIAISGSFVSADALVDSNMSFMTGLNDSSVEVSNVLDTTIQGYEAKVYSYTYAEYVAEEGAAETTEADVQPEDNSFNQIISTYINLNDTHSLSFHIYREDSTPDFYAAEDQLVEFVENYATAFTMVPQEA